MSRRRALTPLLLATTATQASIVVLAPIVVDIGRDFGASVSAVGQARTIMAGTAVLAAFAVGPLIDRIGVRPLIVCGSALALVGALASALSPTLPVFFAAQLMTGAGVACLLSAGFAGVGAFFGDEDTGWAMGYVVGAQSIAWIVGTPLIGVLSDSVSWRLGYALPALAALAALVAALTLAPTQAPKPAAGSSAPGAFGLRDVLRDASARRWTISELVAYAAWTADLTYIGAFYIETYDSSTTTVGFLLAIGSLCFLATTITTPRWLGRYPRRPLVIASALAMGSLVALTLNVTPSVFFTLAVFCVMAVFAGLRTTGSSLLGLDQLPERPGSMMGARTASAQLGYMIGASAGGAVLALAGFGALGFVILTGMAISALLLTGVRDPEHATPRRAREPLPEPVPD